jgi:hypothetical protein
MSAHLERRRRDDDLVLDVTRHLPRPGPKFATAIVWWALGLYALHFAAAPYKPTVQVRRSVGRARAFGTPNF